MPGFARDERGQPIPMLSFRSGRTLAVTTATAAIALPTGFGQVTLLAVGAAMHLRFGSSSVVAGTGDDAWDCYLPAGASAGVPIRPGQTHVAAIGDGAGSLKIMGRE